MRCPKCGFISFDHAKICPKCNKDVSSTTAVVGTTYGVAPPSFLRISKRETMSDDNEQDAVFDGSTMDEIDVVDPDLDVLVEGADDDEGGIDFDADFDSDESEDEDGIAFSFDSDDEEGVDLGQFEDAFDDEEPALSNEITLEFPDELADLSDLSAPDDEPVVLDELVAAKPKPKAAKAAPASPAPDMDEFSLDLDLELDSIDDEFSLSDEEDDGVRGDDSDDGGLGDLSLDDIGLSDEKNTEDESDGLEDDMDADLNFDLDLGDIMMDKDE